MVYIDFPILRNKTKKRLPEFWQTLLLRFFFLFAAATAAFPTHPAG
jgi:hypothetical protein